MSERRYGEREVGLILRRVAELQDSEGEAGSVQGMTRGEIEQVVGELGISRELVARAVADVALRDVRNRPRWWLGGKTDLMFEDVVEGSIDEATLSRMLEVLRRYLGDRGKLEVEAGARIWSTIGETHRRVTFTVVEDRGRTTLRLEERMSTDAKTTVGAGAFTGGFSGFCAAIPLKVLVGKALMALAWGPAVTAGAALGWWVGRTIWNRRSTARERALGKAFDEIRGIAAARGRELPPGS